VVTLDALEEASVRSSAMRKWLLVLGLLGLVATVAEAGTPRAPRGKVRAKKQQKRIRDGIRDRSLTPAEAARLEREQKRLAELGKKIASDGTVTPAEKALMDKAQDKASKHIAIDRHDAQGASGPDAPRKWRIWDPGVNQRQRIQHRRVAQGIHSGSLTPAETRRIMNIESDIRKMERAMKSDGVLTVGERKELHAALNAASQAIFNLKHNGAAVPSVRPHIVRLIESEDLGEAEAGELLAQLLRLLEIERLLGGPAIPAARRAELEAEFADLASQLFA
jgi:hypothetical protein